jgi:molecular chaperone GrpE
MQELDENSLESEVQAPSKEEHEGGEKEEKHKKHSHAKEKEELENLRLELQQEKEKTKDLWDKYLRSVAELQNYKKSVRKEIAASAENLKERMIYDMLPVLDNFERALDPENVKDLESLRRGVELIYNMFKGILEMEGVRDFASVGEVFNPSKHEAVYAVESQEHPAETVIGEVEKGYTRGDRLLRPARVAVSKGPPQSVGKETGDVQEADQPEDEQADKES